VRILQDFDGIKILDCSEKLTMSQTIIENVECWRTHRLRSIHRIGFETIILCAPLFVPNSRFRFYGSEATENIARHVLN
jgi:hypothetical protein